MKTIQKLIYSLWTTFLVGFCDTNYTVTVDITSPIAIIPDVYYGFTFDWWESTDPTYGKKWENAGILTVNLTNKNLITLASAVTPAYLRIGGSPQDSIIYNVTGQVCIIILYLYLYNK